MNEAAKIADHAAQHGPWWLFMVWQFLCISGIVIASRVAWKVFNEQRLHMNGLLDKSIDTNQKLAVVLDASNKAIQMNSLEIHNFVKMKGEIESAIRNQRLQNYPKVD